MSDEMNDEKMDLMNTLENEEKNSSFEEQSLVGEISEEQPNLVNENAEQTNESVEQNSKEIEFQENSSESKSKKKRSNRKSKDEIKSMELDESNLEQEEQVESEYISENDENDFKTSRSINARQQILTIASRDFVESEEDKVDTIWHEIKNAHITGKYLTGVLDGIERTESNSCIAIVYYKGFRVAIPAKEMLLSLENQYSSFSMEQREEMILGKMLGSEVDFIIRGLDNKSRSTVGSRKAAMLRKRQTFYLNKDSKGFAKIKETDIVQARVVAVSDKTLRVDVFGVECSIHSRDLAWDWVGSVAEKYSNGDKVLIRIKDIKIDGNNPETITINADVKSLTEDTTKENLKKCKVQGRYVGKINDIYKGVVFIRLNTGVNAVAHTCHDRRRPNRNDDISFVVTHIDEEKNVAVGIITRILKQNI